MSKIVLIAVAVFVFSVFVFASKAMTLSTIVLAILFGIFNSLRIRKRRSELRNQIRVGDYSLSWDADSICQESSDERVEMPWSAIVQARVWPEWLLLVDRHRLVLVVPRSAQGAKPEAFRAFIEDVTRRVPRTSHNSM